MCLCAAAVHSVFPASPAQGEPEDDARALVARIDAARGAPGSGAATLVVEGTFAVTYAEAGEQPVARGTFRETFVGAAQARQVCEMEGLSSMESGVAGDVVWELAPMAGAKVHTGAQARAVRRSFAMLRGASPAELYEQIERGGSQELDGREHLVLRGVHGDGKPDVWYVDAESALVRRIDITLPTLEDNVLLFGFPEETEAQITFGDWKEVGGVQHPYRRELTVGSMKIAYTCAKVERGAEVEPDAVTPPDTVRKAADVAKLADENGDPKYRLVVRDAQPVASIRVKCKPDEISATLATILPEVLGHVNAVGAKMAGVPFSRYHAVGENEIDLEAGIPVAKPFEEKGRVKNSELPAGKVVATWHIGPYERLAQAHEALRAYADAHAWKPSGGAWELYWTDPGMVPDPAKWRTQLFLPIE